MVETLTHIITKLILPKYPEIKGFNAGNNFAFEGLYSYYYVTYEIPTSLSLLDRRKIRVETDMLFKMLGPKRLDEIDVTFMSNEKHG